MLQKFKPLRVRLIIIAMTINITGIIITGGIIIIIIIGIIYSLLIINLKKTPKHLECGIIKKIMDSEVNIMLV